MNRPPAVSASIPHARHASPSLTVTVHITVSGSDAPRVAHQIAEALRDVIVLTDNDYGDDTRIRTRAEGTVTKAPGLRVVTSDAPPPRPVAYPTPRTPARPATPDLTAPLQLYPDQRVAILDGAPVMFTRREYDLLLFFVEHPGRVFTRQQLLRMVWGDDTGSTQRTIDVHIRRLRVKLRNRGPVITTIHGIGYRLDAAHRAVILDGEIVDQTPSELLVEQGPRPVD